ncbi:hybrid sensor histidine kinase/response regulator [Candidatus Marithrix sp. Canyon 246]|uniref:hybrid sensor histidine kinase/response regulator n=1 Tax=Candidatus Marithrix sp. Canyon 246 TaxID=1827136 RepID=UPI00084A1573|nr:hybrid sensor histidine kinase/response regulator [Candidatus Marithrix sp. Canyon 246]
MNKPVILCVDDEPILLLALKYQLKDYFGNQYQIETAENAEEALEIIEELLADNIELPLVISDQVMPGMLGDELLTQIHIKIPETLTILLTGHADVSAIARAVNNANLYRYIAKPWDPTDFNLTVTEAVRSYFHKKELAEFYKGLEKKVAERTLELERKNQFLSMAVHDLKNPLSIIQTSSEMITNHFDDCDKRQLLEFNSYIFSSTQSMFELITNLLEINEIEAGKLKVKPMLIDIQVILNDLIKHYRVLAKAKGINLYFETDHQSYKAMLDERMISSVLDNLISNAIKYSPYDKSVYIRLLSTETHIRCEIQDEGPGLNEEDQKKLFGQFARLSPQPTADEPATGLGLFIVKQLVETMRGKVWCDTEKDKGATFIVEFPSI